MSELNPQVAEQINNTYPSMLNNFRKIVSWLKDGSKSEHKLPPAVLEFLTKVDDIAETATQASGKADTLAEQVEVLQQTIKELQLANQQQTEALVEQAKLIAELDAKVANAAKAPATKPRSKKADEPVTETVEVAEVTEVVTEPTQDKVQVTAAAVNAGDVSPEGFAQIDGIIDGLFAGVSAPATQQAVTQQPADTLDEV